MIYCTDLQMVLMGIFDLLTSSARFTNVQDTFHILERHYAVCFCSLNSCVVDLYMYKPVGTHILCLVHSDFVARSEAYDSLM